MLGPEDIILKVFLEFIDSRDIGIMNKCSKIFNNIFHKEIIDIIKTNPEAEASGVIGSIEEDATSSMLSDLVFTPFDIPNDRQLRGKLILDCIKRIELDSIKDLKRLINLRLSKDAELTDKDEKELLNELKDLIDREKQLQ